MNCIPPIVSKGHTIYFKHHETDEFFSTILDTNLAFTLDALHTMLYRTNITWSDGSLFVKYHPGYNEIHLQLWTKKKGDLRDHYYKDYVELENTDKVLRVD